VLNGAIDEDGDISGQMGSDSWRYKGLSVGHTELMFKERRMLQVWNKTGFETFETLLIQDYTKAV
jgi:hypothetical protein